MKFDYANRITVMVLNKSDKTAVKDMDITVYEKAVVTEEAADVKSLNGVTNNDGKAVFHGQFTERTKRLLAVYSAGGIVGGVDQDRFCSG